ncbi:MAG: hypothetical protein QM499_00895 [Flavobacteriaceae bacterium]
MNTELTKELNSLSRKDLDKRATEEYGIVDANKLQNKASVIEAIIDIEINKQKDFAKEKTEENSSKQSDKKPIEGQDEPKKETEHPTYVSIKKVKAVKIGTVQRQSNGTAIITPAKKKHLPFTVPAAYMRKFNARGGGYFLTYEDGTQAYQSDELFKSGYKKA